MLNGSCRTIPVALTGVAVAAAMSILPCEVRATNLVSISTLRETIETPHISGSSSNSVAVSKPHGTVTLRKQGIRQIFDVNVRSLSSSLNASNTGWGVWLDPNSTYHSNDLVTLLCQLECLVSTGEHFRATQEGLGMAPPFLSVDVSDLNDLTNHTVGIGFP